MTASVLTFYLNNPIQSGSSAGLLDLNQPVASTSTTGWTPGTISLTFPYSVMSYNAKKTNFSTGPRPDGSPSTVAGHFAQDCWRTASPYTGVFSAGTWYSCASMIAVSAAQSGAFNMRWRIWRASSFSGSNATEITKFSNNSCLLGSVVTGLSTTVAQTSSASTQVASITLGGEYLFLQCAYQIRVANSSANADALFRLGPGLTLTSGSGLITSAFSDTTPAPGGIGSEVYFKQKWMASC